MTKSTQLTYIYNFKKHAKTKRTLGKMCQHRGKEVVWLIKTIIEFNKNK
jgi:hypothetical protein